MGASAESLELHGHMGLAGMRERITALGGSVHLRSRNGSGALLEVLVPAESGRS
jgi:signal transduction histidine kinase